MPSLKGSNEALAQVVQIVLLSLPIFVFARLLERLASRESVYLVDLFRIMTAVSLATFVFTFLKPTQSPFRSFSSRSYSSSRIGRGVPRIARSTSRHSSLAVSLFCRSLSCSSVFALSSAPPMCQSKIDRSSSHGLTMIAWLLPLIYLSESIETRLLTSRLYQQLALQLASLQFAISRPLDHMRLKPRSICGALIAMWCI